MMRRTAGLVFLLFAVSPAPAQTGKHISMAAPEHWVNLSDQVLYDNLSRFQLRPAQYDSLLNSYKGALKIYMYTKYKSTEHAGLIPTIVVSMYQQAPRTFAEFYEWRKKDLEKKKTLFLNFKYIDPISSVIVGGKQTLYYSNTYDLITNNDTLHVRNRTYLVPDGKVFYQMNFADGEGEDCSSVFDALVKTVVFK
jgi:hypothetical protein